MTATVTPMTELHALQIFSVAQIAPKIVTFEQAYTALDINRSGITANVPFSEATLHDCGCANVAGADWRLVYVTGEMNLRELQGKFGTDEEFQPCFYEEMRWWLANAEDEWATKKPEPGYRLFDFFMRFNHKYWDAQSDAIAKMGNQYSRADEVAVAEVCFTNYVTHDERLLDDWEHWGVSLTSDGKRVCVGLFKRPGFYVRRDRRDGFDPRRAVVIERKPDF